MGHWAETTIWKASAAPADEGYLVSFGLVNDGTYIYALIDSFMGTNPYLIKIDPVIHLEVSRFTVLSAGVGGPSVGSVYFDGTYLYMTYNDGGGNHSLIQINPTTMLEVARWTNIIDGGAFLSTITGDGTYIYVGGGGSEARLYQIDPTTMTHVAHWYGNAYDDNRAITSNLIYSGGYVLTPTDMIHFFPNLTNWIRNIDVTTMTEFGFWGSATWGDRGPMVSDGTYLYFKSAGSGTKFTKVDQASVTTTLTAPSTIVGTAFPIIIAGQLYFVVDNGVNAYSIYQVDMTTLLVINSKTITVGVVPQLTGVTNFNGRLIIGWTAITGFPSSLATISEPIFVPSPPSSFPSGNIQQKLVSEGLI